MNTRQLDAFKELKRIIVRIRSVDRIGSISYTSDIVPLEKLAEKVGIRDDWEVRGAFTRVKDKMGDHFTLTWFDIGYLENVLERKITLMQNTKEAALGRDE